MKSITRMMILLLCLFLALPVSAETAAGNETPEYFAPYTFGEMYNELASMFADQYYANLGEETVAQIKKECIFAEEDRNGQFLYLDSETHDVEAIFFFENDFFTPEEPAALWNFIISRNLSGEAINLAAYTLKMMIGYTYQDSVSLQDLSEWFNRLAGPGDGFELPGFTLSMAVTEDSIVYMMLPPDEKNPLRNQETAGNTAAVDEEIRFLDLPWGCDIETARTMMEAAGILTEEADGRFEMALRDLEMRKKYGGSIRSEESYTSFMDTGDGYMVDYEDQASNIEEITLMSDMVNLYLGREVHNISLLFLVEDGTQKLLNVNVSYMISDVDVLPVLIQAYGEPQRASGEEYYNKIWFGENGTALLWSETSLNYGLLNARELIHGDGN